MTSDPAVAVAKTTKTIQLSPRQLCDVELIMNGGLSPLTGFMDETSYKSVVEVRDRWRSEGKLERGKAGAKRQHRTTYYYN